MSLNPPHLRRRLRRGGISLLVLATSSSLLWSASSGTASAGPTAPEPECANGTCTVTFTATGAPQTWTVPAGITSLVATVAGASGASSVSPSAGGLGGRSTGAFTVTPGDELTLVVGSAGHVASDAERGGVGGYGGGGAGGNMVYVGGAGSGGGGGSFVFDEGDLVLAAGGGGAASSDRSGGAGGAANEPASAGTDGGVVGSGGAAGTLEANGSGLSCGDQGGTGEVASASSLPLGGKGCDTFFGSSGGQPGGGGGGGYHAGSGGGAPPTNPPLASGGAGGGGAGFAAGPVTDVEGSAGVQAGDGTISLSYSFGQSITFTSSFDGVVVGAKTRHVSAEGTGAGPIVFGIDPATTNGACTIDGSTVSFVHAGTCVIAADQAGDERHGPGHALQSFTVGLGNQTVTFDPLLKTGMVGDSLELKATGEPGSGSPVVFTLGAATSKGACEVDGTTLRLTGVGTCAVLAGQAGTADYKAAITLVQEVMVSLVATTTALSFDESAPRYGQPVTATATVTGASAGAVQFSVDGEEVGIVELDEDGTASTGLPADLAAGGRAVTAVFTPVEPTTYAGSKATATLAVAKAQTRTTITIRSDEASATVAAVMPASRTPEGTVVFSFGDTISAPVPLSRGKATFPEAIPFGTAVRAAYSGDDDFAESSDSTLREDPTIETRVSSESPKSASGWYRSPVTVSFTCSEGTAPLAGSGCPDPVTLSDDGAAQTVARTVTAEDGGIATVSITGINIDRTKPVVTAFGVEEGARFFSTAPEAGCVAQDALSGVQLCAATRRVKDKAVTYSVAAVDQAGNTSTEVVHATTYTRGIVNAPYVDGAYEVRAGQAVTLVAKSSTRARVMTPTLSPKKPTRNGAKFTSTDVKGEWALGYTIPSSLKAGKTYNLGIRTSSKHTIKIRVVS